MTRITFMAGNVTKIENGEAFIEFAELGYNGVRVKEHDLPFKVVVGQRVHCTVNPDGRSYKEMNFRDWKQVGDKIDL